MRSGVGAPITVEGRLWGMLAAESPREAELPAGSEERLADFAELVATAIANAEARAELRRVADEFRRVADEQAALRRVATLVANGAGPDLVFAAVAEEVGKLFGTDATAMWRFEPDGQATLMGAHRWLAQPDLGTRIKPEPQAAVASVRQTGRAARLDVDDPSSARMSAIARREGIRSMVASPIVVDGRLWGTISMGSRRGPLPPDTEQRLADFTKIVATAIANTESREQLAASRARVVAAGDEMRRRLERDLHDGAQQRLVSLALELRLAQDTIPAELLTLRADIGQAAEELIEVAEELREISRGIHPSVLSEGGLGPALRTLAQRSSVPVELHLETDSRYPPPVEVAAYYVVSEALTNTAKHADASHAEVVVEERGNTLWLRVADDGVGGAKPQSGGSGLIGLRDRVEALGGSIHLTSPVGHGTVIQVSLPIERPDAGPAPANAVRAGR
jgi:signal transduction histidine kinase